MTFPKWIIIEDENAEYQFIWGKVNKHRQLIDFNLDYDKETVTVIGGGWWNIVKDGFFVYGNSVQFGGCEESVVESAILNYIENKDDIQVYEPIDKYNIFQSFMTHYHDAVSMDTFTEIKK